MQPACIEGRWSGLRRDGAGLEQLTTRKGARAADGASIGVVRGEGVNEGVGGADDGERMRAASQREQAEARLQAESCPVEMAHRGPGQDTELAS